MSIHDNKFSFGPTGEEFADSTQRNLPKLTLAPDMEIDPLAKGVNPYDRDPTHKSTGKTQRTDLRKLSEWIKLQKQVEAQKSAPVEETGTHPTLPKVPPKP